MYVRRFNLRHVLLFVGVCGLLLNIAYDCAAFRENKVSDQSGQNVIRQYQVENSLERLEHAIEVLQIPPIKASEFQRVGMAIAGAQHVVSDPHELNVLAGLQRDIEHRHSTPDMAKLVREMSFAESLRTQKQVEQDWAQTARVNHSLIEALIFDILLVAMLFVFFYIELRNQHQIERNFGASVELLRKSNSALQEELARRQLALKTTVHDLKNPLSSIHGFAELLADQNNGSSSIHEFSEVIRRISENSLQMINSLLFKHEDKMHAHGPVDLSALLSQLCAEMKVLAQAKDQILLYNCQAGRVSVHGDRMKLGELFSNLIGNAIKYSPLGKVIWIRVIEDGDCCRVEIEDQGPGFSGEDKARAFNPGGVLSAKPTAGETSTGYGLFIAKQISDLHGARLTIEDSTSGTGALITIEIAKHAYRLISNSNPENIREI